MTKIKTTSRSETAWSPLYFLASLGAGGLVVTFFMYLYHWVPHPNQPVPVFEDIMATFNTGSPPVQATLVLAMAGIAFFAFLHFKLLIWNFRALGRFRATPAWQALNRSNAQTQMKAVPLTLAMSVNVGFMLGLVFVPRLWSVVEFLFPAAILAFVLIGVYAMKLLGQFFGRVLTEGGFDMQANNSFAQLLPAFALSMVAVGLAAPVAMSSTAWIVGLAYPLATFFMVAAVMVSLVALVLGFHSMMDKGTAPEAAPTLMIVIPIMTVLGIALLRLNHGVHMHFDVHSTTGETMVMLSRIVSLQVLFGLLGVLIMRRQSYYQKYLVARGERSAGSYALVCPGVAMSVMLFFFVNKGLVATGLLTKFGLGYWLAMTPALGFQVATIWLVYRLHRLHFSREEERYTVLSHS